VRSQQPGKPSPSCLHSTIYHCTNIVDYREENRYNTGNNMLLNRRFEKRTFQCLVPVTASRNRKAIERGVAGGFADSVAFALPECIEFGCFSAIEQGIESSIYSIEITRFHSSSWIAAIAVRTIRLKCARARGRSRLLPARERSGLPRLRDTAPHRETTRRPVPTRSV
jgi:hypothetical protein